MAKRSGETVVSRPAETRQSVREHEGKKYIRTIHSAVDNESTLLVDVYEVLKAFDVTCPAIQHCVKKLLATGKRGKGDTVDDLIGAMAALNRAIDFAKRDAKTT